MCENITFPVVTLGMPMLINNNCLTFLGDSREGEVAAAARGQSGGEGSCARS